MLLWLLPLLCMGGNMQAQQVSYADYFEDATLRVDYHRTGNKAHDTVVVQGYSRLTAWAGSLTQLLDPFDNGDYRVVVKDAVTGIELYSRGYNTLFREYRDTPAGKDSVATFEEVLRLPYPKQTVIICWEERGEDHQYHQQVTWRFNPDVMEAHALEKAPQYQALKYNGDSHKKIDVVIVPEGYGPGDRDKMMRDLNAFCEYLLAQEPFHHRRKDFNVWAVLETGKVRGITDPTMGIQVSSLVGSSYNTFGSDRYLMTMNLFKLHDVIGETPCDHIIIMANSSTYGGGAIYNFYAMSSLTEWAPYVLPHELGHSIGGLADEYVDEEISYGEMHGRDFEPTEPNITTLVDFDSKWMSMLKKGTPVPTPDDENVKPGKNGPLGVYEGAGYQPKGIYRPVMHCMMRDYAPFCPVCTKRLNEVFDLYTR